MSLSTPLEGPVAIVLALAVGLLLTLALVGKLSALRLKRDGEAVAVKGLIADALDRDPELLGLPLSAAVRVPLLRGKPVIIRISGEVPSDAEGANELIDSILKNRGGDNMAWRITICGPILTVRRDSWPT